MTDADDDHEDFFPSDVDDEGADLLSSSGVEVSLRVGDIVSFSFGIHEGSAGDVDDDSWFSEDDGGWTLVPTRRQEDILFPNLAHHQWGCLMSSVDKYGMWHSVLEKLTTEGLTARSKTLF